MKARLCPLLIFLLFACVATAQDFIGDSRQQVRKRLELYAAETKVPVNIEETDSSLALPFNDARYKPIDFVFVFDKEDKCVTEIRSGCDTCLATFMEQALANSKYQWKQTGSAQFYSNSRFRLLMELVNNEKGGALVVKKMNISRSDYLRLLRSTKEKSTL